MSEILTVTGLTIDALGAIVVVLPDIPPFSKQLLSIDEITKINQVKEEVFNEGSFNKGEESYRILTNIIHENSSNRALPQEINAYAHSYPHDGGNIRYVNSESDSDSDLRGDIATYSGGNFILFEDIERWSDKKIESKQNKLRQHYLRVGAILLAIGFSLQLISQIATTPNAYFITAGAIGIVLFSFFDIVLDQDL